MTEVSVRLPALVWSKSWPAGSATPHDVPPFMDFGGPWRPGVSVRWTLGGNGLFGGFFGGYFKDRKEDWGAGALPPGLRKVGVQARL